MSGLLEKYYSQVSFGLSDKTHQVCKTELSPENGKPVVRQGRKTTDQELF